MLVPSVPEQDGGSSFAGRAILSASRWVPLEKVHNKEALLRASCITGYSTTEPVVIQLAVEEKFHIRLPRFLSVAAVSRFIRYESITDNIQWEKVAFNDLVIPRDAKQLAAWEAFSSAESGVLNIACGGGKTTITLKKIAQRGFPAIVFVNNSSLLDQWVERAQQFLGLAREDIGIVQQDMQEWEKPLVIAMLQTVVARKDDIALATKMRFGTVVYDECFPAGTLVGDKRIEDIVVGDLVPSYDEVRACMVLGKVVRCFTSLAKTLVRVTYAGGSLVCTANHPFLTQRGWVGAGLLEATDSLFEVNNGNSNCDLPELPGHVSDRNCRAKNTTREKKNVLLRNMRACCIAKARTRTRCDKESLTHFRGVYAVRGKLPTSKSRAGGRTAQKNALLLCCMYGKTQGGNLVGDTYGAKQAGRFRQDDKKEPNASCGCAGESKQYPRGNRTPATGARRKRQGSYKVTTVAGGRIRGRVANGIRGTNLYVAAKQAGVTYLLQDRYSQREAARGDRGTRQLTQHIARQGAGYAKTSVLSAVRVDNVSFLEPGSTGYATDVCPDGFVYNIEVEKTHTYLANGVVVHNCHRTSAHTFLQVVEMFYGARYGLTATVKRVDRLEAAYLAHLGPVFYSDDTSELYADVVFKVTGCIPTPTKNFHRADGLMLVSRVYDLLASSSDRNALIVADVVAVIAQKRRPLLLSHSVAHLELLAALLRKALPSNSVGLVHGAVKTSVRTGIFNTSDITLASFTIAKEGLDVPALDTLFLVTPFRDPGAFQQCRGRVERSHPGKQHPLVIVYDDVNVEPAHRMCAGLRKAVRDRDKRRKDS